MTAVLSSGDPLARRDRIMSSMDDADISYSPSSSTDWRAKYNEVADMLSETRAELDEFHNASKELEAELESELQRTEKAQQDLKVKVEKAETERDSWKTKFIQLQTTHNTTTTSLQRELDKLRQEYQLVKVQLRDLEMGNDDLERNERAVSSSLADMEAKYSKALEEKILLEHELLDKANVEEQLQRLKDELRDANVEISILKDQMAAIKENSSASSSPDSPPSELISPDAPLATIPPTSERSEDNLLNTLPPSDLQLSETTPSPVTVSPPVNTALPAASTTVRKTLNDNTQTTSTPSTSASALGRSSTLPTLTPTSRNQRTISLRHSLVSNPSTSSTSSGTASKNKGVQMVSEMRARVKNLEQKIHTRVPRLRMGSVTARSNTNTVTASTTLSSWGRTAGRNVSLNDKSSNLTRRMAESGKQSTDSDSPSLPQVRKKANDDSSGWVLIMEDSPSPPRNAGKGYRRSSSPSLSTGYPISPTLSTQKVNYLNQKTPGPNPGLRRPQSRLSGGSMSTTTTTSSIRTPSSRPSTPTLLPVLSSGGMKRSAGATTLNRTKRSSLGSGGPAKSSPSAGVRNRPTTMPPPLRPASGTPSSASSSRSAKALPDFPDSLHTNVTVRTSRLPSASPSSTAISRIGRPPNSGLSGRRSVAENNPFWDGPGSGKVETRPRASSSANQ